MKFTKHLDWLQFTTESQFLRDFKEGMRVVKKLERSNINQYADCYKLECGGFLYVPRKANIEKQGCLWMLTGKPLSSLREFGYTEQEIVNKTAKNARGCGRIDYCVNIHNGHLNVTDAMGFINRAALGEKGFFISRAKKRKGVVNGENMEIETINIGKSESDRFMTIYDKSVEMNALWGAWIRVEMKQRNKDASETLFSMATDGIHEVGRAVIDRYARFPQWDQLNEALESHESIAPTPTPDNPDSYRAWLEQVLSSVVKSRHDDEKSDAVEWFIKSIENLPE